MRLLRKHTAELIRHTASGYYNDDGDYIEGVGDTPESFKCCIQPDRKRIERVTTPDGVRDRDSRVIYSVTELKGASEVGAKEADIVRYNNLDYVVWDTAPWDGAHHKFTEAVMIRKDQI